MLGIVEGLLELAHRFGFEEFEQVGVANAVFSFVLARVDLEEIRCGRETSWSANWIRSPEQVRGCHG